jgi:thiol:disulfide interchange protein/DsbC/DsbD-like thiol-disulfide interchange protein
VFRLFLCVLFLSELVAPALADNFYSGAHYEARLVTESASPAPGAPLTIGVVINTEPDWHIYWSNPGSSGYAPGFEWILDGGITAGKVRHPVPRKLTVAGFASNIHDGETILLQDLLIPANTPMGAEFNLTLNVDFLVCSQTSCVPDPATLTLTFTVGDGAIDRDAAPLFARARSLLPKQLSTNAVYETTPDEIKIFVPGVHLNRGDQAVLFLEAEGLLRDGALQHVADSDQGLTISTASDAGYLDAQIDGILRIETTDHRISGYRFKVIAEPLPASNPNHEKSDQSLIGMSFYLALAGAFAGGIFLNLMPCVFPIISLKAITLTNAAHDDHGARIEAIGYTIGTVAVVLALGATLLLLRSSGQAVGWAFQLQDPRVVALLLLLVISIATNLTGLFELPSPSVSGAARSGFLGAMGTGALAAFIATPCTGPFMAGALGVAMLLPAPAAMAIFLGLGLGLSAPFLCLGFFKPARSWLPRPGLWMATMRHLLSVPMFATGIGLAWIIGRQSGVGAMTLAISAAMLLGLALWWYGRRQASGKSAGPVLILAGVATIMAISVGRPETAIASVQLQETDSAHVAFDPYQLAELRRENIPVFLYLTADWCLSCKVNEATSISSNTVERAFDKIGAVVMKGDWTDGDPQITAFLKSQGKAGVPLYIWFPASGEPHELPQILTPSMLVGLTQDAT